MSRKMPFKDPLVLLQVVLFVNSFYVNAIDLYQGEAGSFLKLIALSIVHVMGVYSLYCSGSVNTAPNNEAQAKDASACRNCKKEIATRDHHCVYIGQCVGVNNYKHFFSYIFYSYLASTTNIYHAYLHFTTSTMTFLQMYEFYSFWFKVRLVVFVLSALWFTFFTGQLMAYQLYMIANSMTAREHKKQTKQLTYTFKTTIKALLDKKRRQELKEAFAARWMFFFRSKYEFLFCELDDKQLETKSLNSPQVPKPAQSQAH